MKKIITILPGDGIGPEVIDQGVLILEKIAKKYNHQFIFYYGLIGANAIEKTGNPLPNETINLCRNCDTILLGAVGHPKYDNDPKAKIRPEAGLLTLRQKLKLYANLRPIEVYDELINISPLKQERIRGVNIIFVRELTEGIYFGKPKKRIRNKGIAIDTSIYSKKEIEKVAKIAFELAKIRMKKVTSVDKANVLETSRLWRETVNSISHNYPEIELINMFVDNAAMQLIKNPKQFDVVLTENMFGDILTDEASMIGGSIGLLPSASLGEKYSLFEPIHGAYHKASGKNIANPIGSILSVSLMLEIAFKLKKEAETVKKAVKQVISEGFRTQDIADSKTPKEKIIGTKEMGKMISSYI